MTASALALTEAIRSVLVIGGRKRSNEFLPDNANLSPFMQRLVRVRFTFFAIQVLIAVYWAGALLAG